MFNAVVKGFYYIDTPQDYREYSPIIRLENVDVLASGHIGLFKYDLLKAIEKQLPELVPSERAYVLEYFEDNSGGTESYITIKPEKVYQSTGLFDKNGKEIFEGDTILIKIDGKELRYKVKYEIGSFMLVSDDEIFDFKNVWNDNVYPLSQLYFEYENTDNCIDCCEVVERW